MARVTAVNKPYLSHRDSRFVVWKQDGAYWWRGPYSPELAVSQSIDMKLLHEPEEIHLVGSAPAGMPASTRAEAPSVRGALGTLTAGTSKKQRDRWQTIGALIADLEDEFPYGAPHGKLVDRAADHGIDSDTVTKEIAALKDKALIYSPSEGYYRTI